MLLNSAANAPAYWQDSMGYNTETLLDDVSKQMASSNLFRRHSRGASGQRGGSMRVVKTSSAGISPRSSTMVSRRRTLMTDSPYRRRPLTLDPNGTTAAGAMGAYDRIQAPTQASRPVSWHASSHLAPQPYYHSSPGYPVPTAEFDGNYSTPVVLSGYASPASTFSPLSQPFTGYAQQPYQFTEDSFFPNPLQPSTNDAYESYQQTDMNQQMETQNYASTNNMDPSMYSHFDFDNFAHHSFDSNTSPPTPENFLPIQQPDPSFQADEAIPYHPLEDDEPGEVLVGMGLYDAPEKSPAPDPQLDNYRSLLMSQALGTSSYRRLESSPPPPAAGKGLKLEETWNPPPSDDDEDEDDEDGEDEEGDDDAEGDDADEEIAPAPEEPVHSRYEAPAVVQHEQQKEVVIDLENFTPYNPQDPGSWRGQPRTANDTWI